MKQCYANISNLFFFYVFPTLIYSKVFACNLGIKKDLEFSLILRPPVLPLFSILVNLCV